MTLFPEDPAVIAAIAFVSLFGLGLCAIVLAMPQGLVDRIDRMLGAPTDELHPRAEPKGPDEPDDVGGEDRHG